jgi:type IV secretion system protein VirB9
MRHVNRSFCVTFGVAILLGLCSLGSRARAAETAHDPRLREVWYDPQVVVTVPVQRGVVTHVLLELGEAITEVGSGLGADCSKPDASWCVAAQPGGRSLYVKPKSTARDANNLAVVTNQRTYAFRFVVLPKGDARPPVYRLTLRARSRVGLAARSAGAAAIGLPAAAQAPLPNALLASRLNAAPTPVNSHYAVASGRDSQDIVPTLVFDDGRFTYLKFPNNREVPAVFGVSADGTETLINARMEGDLLVVDRVSRRLVLRAGQAVVGVWNDAFDIDGVPPHEGTTVAGVRRSIKVAPVVDNPLSIERSTP